MNTTRLRLTAPESTPTTTDDFNDQERWLWDRLDWRDRLLFTPPKFRAWFQAGANNDELREYRDMHMRERMDYELEHEGITNE